MLEKEVQSRHRLGAKVPFTKEYYLKTKSYVGWYTIAEMIDFSECTVEKEALRCRIFKTKRFYKDLWDAITYKKRSQRRKCDGIAFTGGFVDFMFLLPVGSLHKDALAMQSKSIIKGKKK